MEPEVKKKTIKIILTSVAGLIVIGMLIGTVLSYTAAVVIQKTADDKFCATCHTMQPMIDAYEQDVHGGNNSYGFKAKCLDCHLPHNSLAGYILAKAKTGTHDVWAEATYDKSKIDWQEKRRERSRFTYDSGCLHCHEDLEKQTMGNTKAFIAHKAYFLKSTTRTCVDCHKHVGHHLLGKHLNTLKVEE